MTRDEFFDLYFKFNTEDINKGKAFVELKKIANKTESLKGWPEDKLVFWDVESFFWANRFNKLDREFILNKINKYISNNHLDIGCGALPVDSKCVCMDCSKDMLDMVKNNKIVFDFDGNKFPFGNSKFESISALFVLNYIKNLNLLLSEISRVLTEDGKLIIVQSYMPINEFHRQKEVNNHDDILDALEQEGFFVEVNHESYNKVDYLILICSR